MKVQSVPTVMDKSCFTSLLVIANFTYFFPRTIDLMVTGENGTEMNMRKKPKLERMKNAKNVANMPKT